MFCRHCGNILPDTAKFCNSCGAPVERPAQVNPESTRSQDVFQEFEAPKTYESNPYNSANTNYDVYGSSALSNPVPRIRFSEAIRMYFSHYLDFSGRSRRCEFWYAVLFVGLIGGLIGAIFGNDSALSNLWDLATLLPSLAVGVRRLHDVGKPGTYYLWILLPIVGWIILLIQFTRDSDPSNQWGPNPKLR